MATYTGTADANGDFSISFGANTYTSGEKITLTTEKDSATKSIELFAPSDVVGGGVIQFTGSLDYFPANIGGIIVSGITNFENSAFYANNNNLFKKATSLEIKAPAAFVSTSAFRGWTLAASLILPSTITNIGSNAFDGWSECNVIYCYATTPPAIAATSFIDLKSTCIFKVPAGSVAAYQAAANWSAFAARIEAI